MKFMKSTQSQKTFTMLEHALWQTVLKIQSAMAKVDKNLSRTCLTVPNADYFRTQTTFSEGEDPEFQHVSIWNYYVGLEFKLKIGNNEQANSLTAFYRTPGESGGRFQSQIEESKVQNFRDVFTGCLPRTKAFAIGDEEEQVELETLEMLWNYVKEDIFGEVHNQHASDPGDFLKLVECCYDRDIFDILDQGENSLTVGNDLVNVKFTILGDIAVEVCVEYMLGNRVVSISETMSNVSERHFIYPFCYTIRPLRAHLSQE